MLSSGVPCLKANEKFNGNVNLSQVHQGRATLHQLAFGVVFVAGR
jgi:hypothetical protein